MSCGPHAAVIVCDDARASWPSMRIDASGGDVTIWSAQSLAGLATRSGVGGAGVGATGTGAGGADAIGAAGNARAGATGAGAIFVGLGFGGTACGWSRIRRAATTAVTTSRD